MPSSQDIEATGGDRTPNAEGYQISFKIKIIAIGGFVICFVIGFILAHYYL